MTIARLRVELLGSPIVGPGLMTFYTRNLTNTLPGAVKTFLTSIAAALAPGINCVVPNGGDTIDEATGQLVGTWSSSGGGTVASTGSGPFTLGSGCRVEWYTGTILDGSRVRGRTYIVPITNGNFGTDGRLLTSPAGTIKSAADALVTAGGGDLVIWRRPRKASTGPSGPISARAGSAAPVTSTAVPTVPTALRSRRM